MSQLPLRRPCARCGRRRCSVYVFALGLGTCRLASVHLGRRLIGHPWLPTPYFCAPVPPNEPTNTWVEFLVCICAHTHMRWAPAGEDTHTCLRDGARELAHRRLRLYKQSGLLHANAQSAQQIWQQGVVLLGPIGHFVSKRLCSACMRAGCLVGARLGALPGSVCMCVCALRHRCPRVCVWGSGRLQREVPILAVLGTTPWSLSEPPPPGSRPAHCWNHASGRARLASAIVWHFAPQVSGDAG